MAITVLDFESGANGDSITSNPGNSGFTSHVTTGGTLQISTGGTPPSGTRCMLSTGTSANGGVYGSKAITATATLAYDFDFKIDTLPSAEAYFFWVGHTSISTRAFAIAMATDGKIRVRDSANAAKWAGAATTSTTTLATNTWYRISVFATQNATTGSFRVVIYAANGTTVIEDTTLQSNINTGSANFDGFRAGIKTSTGTGTGAFRYDRIRYDETASAILAAPTAVPPVLPGSWTNQYYEYLDLSATTSDVGPIVFSASPSTNVVGDGEDGIFLPVNDDGTVTAYTITVTDTGNGATDTMSYDASLQGVGSDIIETVVWDGSVWV